MIICPRSCCHIIQHVWATRSQTEFAPSPWEGIRGGHEELKREPVKKFVSCIWVSNEEGRFLQAETDLIPWINYSLKSIHPTSINRVSLCFFGEKKTPWYSTKAKKEILEILFTLKQNGLFTGCWKKSFQLSDVSYCQEAKFSEELSTQQLLLRAVAYWKSSHFMGLPK